ncbi:C-type lectin domain family 12 member B isoform X2 [Ochotona curzoniae]|uniref:C-type lectin domain family 12 member B isoform X2 n=1 Tax=Ochotona curzoniae TaxID=130825 RepID=UPI001B350E2A|nr:C-type lectin domain family 12 member B isoform X2 [Ochotona curzoniae]
MSDEVTYATLTLQDSTGARNNRLANNLREQRAPSSTWRQAALGLLLVCLMLLAGLVTLGIMFLQMSNEMNSDSEELNRLQKITHQQQDNLSQQLSHPGNLTMEEKSLKSQISKLLKRQGQLAIKLCQELILHTSDHRCNPCPETWQWHQDSCYYFMANEEKTWTDSRKDCMDKNSSLAKIDSWEEKNFLKSRPLPTSSFFWLGLSWDHSSRNWLWEDGSIPSPSLFNTKELAQINGSKGCAYLQKGNIYISRCSAEISWICEKTAAPVKVDNLD